MGKQFKDTAVIACYFEIWDSAGPGTCKTASKLSTAALGSNFSCSFCPLILALADNSAFLAATNSSHIVSSPLYSSIKWSLNKSESSTIFLLLRHPSWFQSFAQQCCSYSAQTLPHNHVIFFESHQRCKYVLPKCLVPVTCFGTIYIQCLTNYVIIINAVLFKSCQESREIAGSGRCVHCWARLTRKCHTSCMVLR